MSLAQHFPAASTARRNGSGHAWVSRLFQAIDGCDWDALEAMLDPSVVYERPGYAPFEGAAALLHFYRHTRIIASGRHDVHGVLEDGDMLTNFGCFEGVSHDGGLLDVSFCDVCWLNGDLLRRRRTFFFVPAV